MIPLPFISPLVIVLVRPVSLFGRFLFILQVFFLVPTCFLPPQFNPTLEPTVFSPIFVRRFVICFLTLFSFFGLGFPFHDPLPEPPYQRRPVWFVFPLGPSLLFLHTFLATGSLAGVEVFLTDVLRAGLSRPPLSGDHLAESTFPVFQGASSLRSMVHLHIDVPAPVAAFPLRLLPFPVALTFCLRVVARSNFSSLCECRVFLYPYFRPRHAQGSLRFDFTPFFGRLF